MRNDIRTVTDAEKTELEQEWQKVGILLSYEEIVCSEVNLLPLVTAWDKLQVVQKKLDECYGDNGETYLFGQSLGARKGAVTKASTKVFNEIDIVFGRNQNTSVKVYEMLTHGRIQKAHEFNLNQEARKECLAKAGL